MCRLLISMALLFFIWLHFLSRWMWPPFQSKRELMLMQLILYALTPVYVLYNVSISRSPILSILYFIKPDAYFSSSFSALSLKSIYYIS